MMTRTLILALSLTAAAVPAAAQAESTSQIVRIDDLDLTRATDRERLDTRLASAARSICHTGLRGLAELSRRAECMAAVRAEVAPQTERVIAQAHGGTQLALLMVRAAR